jgi:hypothetical protein
MSDEDIEYHSKILVLSKERFIRKFSNQQRLLGIYVKKDIDIISIGNVNLLICFQKKIDRQLPIINFLLKNTSKRDYYEYIYKLFGYEKFNSIKMYDYILGYSIYKYKLDNKISKNMRSNYKVRELMNTHLKFLFHNEIDYIDKNLVGKKLSSREHRIKVSENKKLFLSHSSYKNLNNLDNFSEFLDEKRIWSPYLLALASDIKVCPYCNRQYVTPIMTSSGKLRGDIDHFFAKRYYPLLSLSLYNMIPSCLSCNRVLKSDEQLDYNALHPYRDDIDEHFKFTLVSFSNGEKEITTEKTKKAIKENSLIDDHLTMFKIEELYSYHMNHVDEIIKTREMYNETYINFLYRRFNKLFSSRVELEEHIIGYTKTENFNNETLSKFRKDIIDQLWSKHMLKKLLK